MEIKIKFETEIKYSDRVSLDLSWIRKLSEYIYKNISSLGRDYYSHIGQRLIRYPHFYYNGYIKFFTERREIIYPFDNENSKTIADFMRDELTPIVLSTYFFSSLEENELLTFNENGLLTLNIKLKLDLIEKI